MTWPRRLLDLRPTFLIIMPLVGLFEKPKPLPNSISEAILAKSGGSATPAGAG